MDGDRDYESWSKEALIARLRSLEDRRLESSGPRNHHQARSEGFEFERFPRRKVALKFSYFGWAYHGLARQGGTLESDSKRQIEAQYPTVEGELFRALAQCKLIASEADCDYSRCGRTDRGVSSFGQVVALYVRSLGRFVGEDEAAGLAREQGARLVRDEANGGRPVLLPEAERELPYANMLNKHLPPEIRVLAWSPVRADFSARFSCKSRFYRYFFSQEGLDIAAMQDAARRYLGTHDFRNFCRLDPAKQIQNFERTVLAVAISPVPAQVPLVADAASPAGRWWQLELRGTAFLWHQVRCMMAVLFAVGQGLEDPDIVDRMMDVAAMAGKPEYEMACDTPLVLADCAFDAADVQWRYVRAPGHDAANMAQLDRAVSQLWGQLNTQAVISSALLQALRDTRIPAPTGPGAPLEPWADCRARLAQQPGPAAPILGGGLVRSARKYVPIAQRRRADPVELRNQAWLARKGAAAGGRKRSRDESDGRDPEPAAD
ncbi:pseudouridine synthase deg1 [Coemansia javaensis]|uniref:tRNA pseudouridine synthase n=1 Tax=Coemansia javaensis TaxID=2761396 RepID=A0A9W8HCS6_9FUNG|nr:pseudouridine synthase deg1 [Coemansia javaensis]